MLHVAEEDVDLISTMVEVAKTILMDSHLPRDPFAIQSWSNEDIIEIMRFAI